VSIAPWQVQLNAIKLAAPGVRETAETLYRDLQAAGIEVVYDDRDERPGVQFAEADLLGAPFRLIVSERNLANGCVEWKRRAVGDSGTMPVGEAVETARGWVDAAMAELERAADAL